MRSLRGATGRRGGRAWGHRAVALLRPGSPRWGLFCSRILARIKRLGVSGAPPEVTALVPSHQSAATLAQLLVPREMLPAAHIRILPPCGEGGALGPE